jgi:peptidoglycan/LPS O-acetylase OafA/YrhL
MSSDGRDARPVGVALSTVYLPELESLRGLAAVLVLAFHYDSMAMLRAAGDWCSLPYALVRGGHSGVNLFFVLSAFLLSLPFLAAGSGGPPVSLRRYATRRALRILPLYYAIVLVATLVTASTPAMGMRALPYLFFLNGFGDLALPMPPFSNVWWSLATEMQFYLVLPLLPLAIRSRRGRVIGLAVLGGYATAWVFYERREILTLATVDGAMLLSLSLFGRGPVFLFGIGAAVLYRRHGDDWRRRAAAQPWLRAGGADLLLLAVLVALAAHLRWLVFIGAARYHAPPEHAWQALGGLLWASLLLLLLVAPLRLKPVLHNRWWTRLGVLSYSIYVLHLPVISGVRRGLQALGAAGLGRPMETALVLALSAALSIALAAVTYRLIEYPFLRRKEAAQG